MDNSKKELIFDKLKKNAKTIKLLLTSSELNLAELDKFLRERELLFSEIKKYKLDKSDQDNIGSILKDNDELIKLLKKKRNSMEIEFKKKKNNVSKILHYLKN